MRSPRLIAFLAAVGAFGLVAGATTVLPHTFEAGGIISASEMNANFRAILDGMVHSLNGKSGEVTLEGSGGITIDASQEGRIVIGGSGDGGGTTPATDPAAFRLVGENWATNAGTSCLFMRPEFDVGGPSDGGNVVLGNPGSCSDEVYYFVAPEDGIYRFDLVTSWTSTTGSVSLFIQVNDSYRHVAYPLGPVDSLQYTVGTGTTLQLRAGDKVHPVVSAGNTASLSSAGTTYFAGYQVD